MKATHNALAALLGLLFFLPGCKQIATVTYFLTPPRTQPAEYTLTQDRLVIFVEPAQPSMDNPVFNRALADAVEKLFRERQVSLKKDQKINQKVVPQMEMLRLRQAHPDLSSWSLQRIGRELNADEVLDIRVERLQLRETPDSPVLAPQVTLRIKVIGTYEPADKPRVWPPEREGREVSCSRQAEEALDMDTLDRATVKLARDTAQIIVLPFQEVDLEAPTPKER